MSDSTLRFAGKAAVISMLAPFVLGMAHAAAPEANAGGTPAATIDSNNDGKPDAWDRDSNGTADAWDTNADGKPDAFDENGDGKPDRAEPAKPQG